jgi:sirohydrochlorin ferrochelatase
MKAILLIDHGSRRAEANEMLYCIANLVQTFAGPNVIVRPAHMELTEPTVAQGFRSCVDAGATEVIAFPYMLSPGRHSIEHIPEMVADAARNYPGVSFRVTAAFGVHEKLAELILLRTGVQATRFLSVPLTDEELLELELAGAVPVDENEGRCWQPDGRIGACGDACPAAQPAARQALADH